MHPIQFASQNPSLSQFNHLLLVAVIRMRSNKPRVDNREHHNTCRLSSVYGSSQDPNTEQPNCIYYGFKVVLRIQRQIDPIIHCLGIPTETELFLRGVLEFKPKFDLVLFGASKFKHNSTSSHWPSPNGSQTS